MRAERASSPEGAAGSACLLLDVDELGLPAGETNLDPAGNLGVERERDLVEEVEQPQLERGLERLREPPARLLRGLVAGERGGGGEVLLDRVDVGCQLHGRTMTSL